MVTAVNGCDADEVDADYLTFVFIKTQDRPSFSEITSVSERVRICVRMFVRHQKMQRLLSDTFTNFLSKQLYQLHSENDVNSFIN